MAGAWMGLAVKTDGAAVASGAITEALIRARALQAGINYEAGWIMTTTTTVKVFIDVFIGVWAFVLAVVWAYGIDASPGRRSGSRRSGSDSPVRLRVFRTFWPSSAWRSPPGWPRVSQPPRPRPSCSAASSSS